MLAKNRKPDWRNALVKREQAVMQFIGEKSDLWNFAPEDLETIEVVSVSRPTGRISDKLKIRLRAAFLKTGSDFSIKKLKTVNLIQRVDGMEALIGKTAAVNNDNEVITVSGQFFPGISEGSRAASRMADAGDNVLQKKKQSPAPLSI